MGVRSQFTDAELDAVRDAASAAESRTAGEIVAVVVDRCETYRDTAWKAAAIGAIVASLVATVVHTATFWWGLHPVLWILLPVCTGAAIGVASAIASPAVRRVLTGPQTLTRRVRRRAAVAFMEEGVSETRDRTGVLVLVGLFERRVEIVADVGLHERVAPEAWRTIADQLVADLRRGRPGPALRDAVTACGQVLVDAGVAVSTDDRNELTDDVRLRDA